MINLKKLLPEDHIETTNQILTWQEAVQLASQPLLNEKAIDQQYVANMIHSVEENGPYMVLADSCSSGGRCLSSRDEFASD